MKTTQSMKGMRYAVAAMALHACGAFQQPRITRGTVGTVALRAKPKVVVFDLDGCLWDPEMYELWGGGAPFSDNGDGTLKDRSGVTVRLLGAV